MRVAHLILGILLFVAFTVTGRMMRVDFPEKEEMDQMLRILTRSRHIYILFNSLIHISLGVYLTIRPATWRKTLQYLGSILLTASGLLLLWGWWAETYQYQHFSDISRWGIYTSLAGIIAHLIGGLTRGVSSK